MGLPLSLLAVLRERRIPYLVTLLDYWWLCANANLLTNHAHQRCGGPRAGLNCTRCVVARSGSPLAWGVSPALWGMLVDRNRQLRSALAEAAALLAPSEFVRSWYAGQGAGTPQLVRWGVIPFGEEVSIPQLDSSQLNLLYVGGLAPNKGVHVLLAALRKVVGRVQLVVAGDETSDPGYVAELHQLADTRVRFVGRLNRRQVWEQMKGADAVMVPSLWHETFCLVAHEALAAGTPVVASALGALLETVQDGVNGFLLSPGDVLAWQQALQCWVDERQRLRSLRATVTPPRQFLQHVEEVESIYRAQLEDRP
jgi:glycosyltransferase involved in cell wall biosynthesis